MRMCCCRTRQAVGVVLFATCFLICLPRLVHFSVRHESPGYSVHLPAFGRSGAALTREQGMVGSEIRSPKLWYHQPAADCQQCRYPIIHEEHQSRRMDP
jgi:hypothetical protein